jgi:hypothetical protein
VPDPTVPVAVLSLGTGLTCAVLALARIGDRSAQLTHAGMGVAMAGMLSPWGDPLSPWAGAAGFTLLGAWFTAAAVRGARGTATPQHLAISSAAMVLMYLLPGHHAGDGTGGVVSLVVMPLALTLAGYFVWHTWKCVDRVRTPAATGTTPIRGARTEPVAHGLTSALMAAMFLGAV